MPFVHLHVHTQYSVLDGLSDVKGLFARARELGMPALAITDHGNMFGVKEFLDEAFSPTNAATGGGLLVKPIVGCEIYVTRGYDHRVKDAQHKGYYHLTLLAKDRSGYDNLMKICTLGYVEGRYYRPRVSHEVVERHSGGLICLSACIAGEIAQRILAGDHEGAREAVRWHRRVFGDDYYLEAMLHPSDGSLYERQKAVCDAVFRLAAKEGVRVVATNDVHFIRKEDGPAHDRLICLTTNARLDDPSRLRYTQQEWLKDEDEMAALFPGHPEILAETLAVADKVQAYKIDHDHILPRFALPESFAAAAAEHLSRHAAVIEAGACDAHGAPRGDAFRLSVAYLCHLAYDGAGRLYGTPLPPEVTERLDFELRTIAAMGFPDYFLIVQDYIRAMRRDGWLVGPGRGSAAGSVVAYCLGITNIDPLRYGLLFERFLNPDRISMPDIDVDFESTDAVHRYVEEKYGVRRVARVVTFGTMKAKAALRDVARIYGLPPDEASRLSSLVPSSLTEVSPDGRRTDVPVTIENCRRMMSEFQAAAADPVVGEVLEYAARLEGCIRQVGMHPCATVIAPGDVSEYVPVCLSKDKGSGQDVWTSQYDGHYIEACGLLKMDLLGLRTLSVIHGAVDLIRERHGVAVDVDRLPMDDGRTYALYARGDTTAVFQFESPGMREWLRKLRPTRFEDLVAMNALYRPGPMDYIPDFVDRKAGRRAIAYDLPEMEPVLRDTYGVTVYQEQVMMLSRILAGFTRGQADKLRKAMGKKNVKDLEDLYGRFMEGGAQRGHPAAVLEKIWNDWRSFAEYAFNKSHATCYAWVSYQTAWLKANYTAEFLAANLSCSMDDTKEMAKLMEDCLAHGIAVAAADVNASGVGFSVDAQGRIRYGLGGIKGLGESVAAAIVAERRRGGPYADVYDFAERVPAGVLNRRVLDALSAAGAFDAFGDVKRKDFSAANARGETFSDLLVRYAALCRRAAEQSSATLFGDVEEMKPPRPAVPGR